MPRGCWSCCPTTPCDDSLVADIPRSARAGRPAGGERYESDRSPAQRPSHRPRHRTEDRGDADQTARRLALAGAGQTSEKTAQGDIVRFGNEGKVCLLGHLDAQVEHKGDDGEITLSFSFHGPALDQAIADLGAPPLPPYIASKRTPDERDAADYQTMFAANEGAVAAPTAGLHFTPALEAALREQGIGIHRVTLHVGAGTFLPVKVDDTAGHKMHSEWGTISRATADALNAARARAAVSSLSAPPRCGFWKARRRKTA